MKVTGVERVVFFFNTPEKVDEAAAFYSRLLNTSFHSSPQAELGGLHNAWSYEAGIEIVAPLPGTEEPNGEMVAGFLKERGEGMHAVVMQMDDVQAARDNAVAMGVNIIGEENYDADTIRDDFDDRFETYIEFFLDPKDTYGIFVTLGQLEQKPQAADT